MQKHSSKAEFLSLLAFLAILTLLITNAFAPRIHAQGGQVDIYPQVEPIGEVLTKILDEYVHDPDLDRVVEGAIFGMMSALGGHNSYIPAQALTEMREDTRGEFEGIGIQIREENGQVLIFTPVDGAPAAEAGLLPGDIITAVDDVTTEQMWSEAEGNPAFSIVSAVADKIRGKRGTTVKITVSRDGGPDAGGQILDFVVKRDKVPLNSVVEARLLPGNIGYIRLKDFKDNSAADIRKHINDFKQEGMTAFVLDLRWNPGGLLSASQEVCDLFLPKKSLVTYTKGRERSDGRANTQDLQLYTEHAPVLPAEFPMVVLVNGDTASSAEIVTGALQFHQRALVLGEKTFGKGSVQTIIPLKRPEQTALRLTTALYYTPADVTIDHQGILPDVEVIMTEDEEKALINQLFRSYEKDPTKRNTQNHGTVSGHEVTEADPSETEKEEALLKEIAAYYGDDVANTLRNSVSLKERLERTVEDRPLLRAVELIQEAPDWTTTFRKYHRDISETQVAASTGTQRLEKASPIAEERTAPALPEAPEAE